MAGASGLPSLDNIPSVADLTASFNARKEERLRLEAEQKEAERRVSDSRTRPARGSGGRGWGGLLIMMMKVMMLMKVCSSSFSPS